MQFHISCHLLMALLDLDQMNETHKLFIMFKKFSFKKRSLLKGHWTSVTSSPQFLFKKVEIFIPKEVLAKVMTACWLLHSSSTYFLRNIAICSNFYFLKSTSKNTQYSGLWDTLGMMLFTKKSNEMKTLWRNRLKFLVLVYYKVFFRTKYKKIDVILVQCPFKNGKKK